MCRLHPGMLPELVEMLGRNIVCQFGSGLFCHPGGAFAGARAIRQSLDAAMKRIPLKKYAMSHPELKAALNYFCNQ